jgi:hypothetical protein
LEQAVANTAWFSRGYMRGGVTIEVIFGTVNRVSRRRSKNPQMRIPDLAQFAVDA